MYQAEVANARLKLQTAQVVQIAVQIVVHNTRCVADSDMLPLQI